MPVQAEATVRCRGGPKQSRVYWVVWHGYRGEKPIETPDSWFQSKLALVKPLRRWLLG